MGRVAAAPGATTTRGRRSLAPARSSRRAATRRPVYADLAQARAIDRLDAGAAAARPQRGGPGARAAAALRRRDGARCAGSRRRRTSRSGSAGTSSSPTRSSCSSGSSRTSGLRGARRPRALKGCGGRRHVETKGWAGEWFSGRVIAHARRAPATAGSGQGITPLAPTEAWVERRSSPTSRGTNQPIGINDQGAVADRDPHAGRRPAPVHRRAGDDRPAANCIPFIGPEHRRAAMTLGLAARDCGFGPGVLYYNMAADAPDVGRASSAFAIDFVRYLRFAAVREHHRRDAGALDRRRHRDAGATPAS